MQDQLLPDEALGVDQFRTSLNGRYTFIYQGDGNLVLYKNYRNQDRRALWASNSNGRPVEVCRMQGDGNLVIYGPGAEYVWDSGTHGSPGSRLIVQDDGNVVIYRPDDTPIWATNTVQQSVPAGPPAQGDDMQPAEVLNPDQSITSPNGNYTFVYQGDGNLVLYRNRDGKALWASNTYGRPAEVCIMQGDGNLVIYGPDGEYIWDTATHGHPGSHLVVQDDGNVVIYDPAGTPIWATNTNIVSVRVPGFLPSTNGFQFSNSFPNVPDLQIDVLGANVAIGNAANGLCGGMVYAVRDIFEAGRVPPPMTTGPSSGPLFDHIVRRLFDSFELPTGPIRYMFLMNPTLPDHETSASEIGLAPHGRAWVMINEEWPKIREDLDAGRPSPMALVHVKSLNPGDLGHNHQVLAYGYVLEGEDLRILIYDPNCPGNDNVAIELSIGHPQNTTAVRSTCPNSHSEVYCFFRPAYTFVSPPDDLTTIPVERIVTVRNTTPSDQMVRVFNPGDLVMGVAVTAGEFNVGPMSTDTWVFQNGMSQVKLTANGRPLGLANPGDTIVIAQDDSVLVRNVTSSPIRARFYNSNDGLMWVTLPNGDQSIDAYTDFRYSIPSDLNSVKIVIQGQTFGATLGDVVVFGP